MVALLCLIFSAIHASASLSAGDDVNLTSAAAAPNAGFWVQMDGGSNNSKSGRARILRLASPFANVAEMETIVVLPVQEQTMPLDTQPSYR
jgi:hypothetical protein